MAKKYVINSILVVLSILLLGSLFLPFYVAQINATYGTTVLSGSINISGVGFAFGLPFSLLSWGSGDFSGKDYAIIEQPIFLIIVVIDVTLFISSICSLATRRKQSVFFFMFNIILGLVAAGGGVISYFALDISAISMEGERGLISEGMGYGTILNISLSAIFFILSIVLSFISLWDYRMSLKYQNDQPLFKGNMDFSGHDRIEEVKIHGAIEEKKKPASYIEEKKVVINAEIDNTKVNHNSVNVLTKEEVKPEINTNSEMEKLDKLYDEGKISMEEYFKMRAAIMRKSQGNN